MQDLTELNPTLFITGASGFMGSNLIRSLSFLRNLYAQYHRNFIDFPHAIHLRADLASEREVKKIASLKKFDFAIHLAALTSVDECEKNKSYARKLNVEATKNIVSYFNDKNVPVLYISTDLVFDGMEGNYNENSAVNPINYYGETKVLAENIVLEAMRENTVFRIALSYGKSYKGAKGGYLDFLLNALTHSNAQLLFTDQFRTPLYSGDFCSAVKKFLEHKIQNHPACKSRIFHIAGNEKVSRFEFGIRTCEVFKLDKSLLKPTVMKSLENAVKRGSDCSMDITLSRKEFGYQPEPINDNLQKDKNIRKEEAENANLHSH